MTGDAILVVQALFSMIWRLFTTWHIPGTNVTPASWAFFALSAVLVIRVCRMLFGYHGSDGGNNG